MKKAVGSFMKIVHAESLGDMSDYVTKDGSGEIHNLIGMAKFSMLDPLRVLNLFRKIKQSVLSHNTFKYSTIFRIFPC